jgi:hypothetical protein
MYDYAICDTRIPVSAVWSKYLIVRKAEGRKKRENEERKREKKVSQDLVLAFLLCEITTSQRTSECLLCECDAIL